jgi:3-mercaptopyruvate sulfurtransferase SseA
VLIPSRVDVRENDEVALGSIPSAVSLPLSVLKEHLSPTYNAGTFQSEHAFAKPLPEQKMIFFCRSGKRSATACQLASEAGYKNLRNYEGSWLDWTKKEAEGGQGGYKGDDDD